MRVQTLESKKPRPELASVHRGTLLRDYWTPAVWLGTSDVTSVSNGVTSLVFFVSEHATPGLHVIRDVTLQVFPW